MQRIEWMLIFSNCAKTSNLQYLYTFCILSHVVIIIHVVHVDYILIRYIFFPIQHFLHTVIILPEFKILQIVLLSLSFSQTHTHTLFINSTHIAAKISYVKNTNCVYKFFENIVISCKFIETIRKQCGKINWKKPDGNSGENTNFSSNGSIEWYTSQWYRSRISIKKMKKKTTL